MQDPKIRTPKKDHPEIIPNTDIPTPVKPSIHEINPLPEEGESNLSLPEIKQPRIPEVDPDEKSSGFLASIHYSYLTYSTLMDFPLFI